MRISDCKSALSTAADSEPFFLRNRLHQGPIGDMMQYAEPLISIDLLESARRSDSFPTDWDTDKVRSALHRYEHFLRLAAKNPGERLAPTRDIDEMWHLHMLSPKAYFSDCDRLLGRILDHNGGFGKEAAEVPELRRVFQRTAELWQREFGEPYVRGFGEGETSCWHACQGECWHACSE